MRVLRMTACSLGLRDVIGTSKLVIFIFFERENLAFEGLLDIIGEVMALIMRACSQKDCVM